MELSKDKKLDILKKSQIIMQRELNKYIYSEIEAINNLVKDKNIFPVYVKGIVLAHQLYEVPESRIFGDIDVFIDRKDIVPFLYILKDMGYILADGREISEKFEKCKHQVHLPPLVRSTGNLHDLCIEIHTTPFFINAQVGDLLSDEDVSHFLSYREEIEINGLIVNTLTPEANFLYLLDHFVKHIIYDIVEIYFYRNDKGICVNKEKLNEIILFYKKFCNNIDLNLVKSIAERFNAKMTTMMGLKYLREIAPEVDIRLWNEPDDMIENPRFEDCIAYLLLKNTSFSELKEKHNDFKFVNNLFNQIGYMPNVRLKIPLKTPGISGRYFSIEKCDDLTLRGTLSWDYEYMHMNAMLKDQYYPECAGNLIRLLFDNRKNKNSNNIKLIFVRILLDNSNPDNQIFYYDIVLNGYGRISDKCRFTWSGEEGAGFSVALSIPWDVLDFEPQVNAKAGLEVIIANHDGFECKRFFQLSDFEKRWLPYYLPEIELGEAEDFIFS